MNAYKSAMKLERSQVRMMLDYLGIKLDDQQGKIGDLKRQLSVCERADNEEYKRAYDSVVLHKTSTGAIEKVIPVADASHIVDFHIREIESGALNAIEKACAAKIAKRENELKRIQHEFVNTVKERMTTAIERESKKFNVTAIKINNKKPKAVDGVVHELFPRMIQLAEARKNILLVGPSGCGKTHIAKQIADQLGMRYGSQSCSAGVSESAFSGWLLPIGEDGRFDYVMSVFIDIYEKGGVFLFDEMDNSDANMLVFLNQALAQDHFFLPQRYKKSKVKKHKDFIAVGAANTFGDGADNMYHGRIALDKATLDRFRLGTIFMDYSPAVEEKLVDPEILDWGRMVRKKIADHKLTKLMSTRVMIDGSDLKEQCDWSIEDIELGYFADWSREEKAVCGFQLRGDQ